MDSSIEIIGEVRKECINLEGLNSSIELDVSCSNGIRNQTNYDSPKLKFASPLGMTPRRPVRKRKAVKNYSEEQEEEFTNKRKRRKITPKSSSKIRPKQQRSFLRVSNRDFSKSSLKKNKNDLEIVKEVTKVARSEAGGAGTLISRHKKKLGNDPDIEIVFEWDPAKVISERQGVAEWQARSVLKLFDQENTLPFIARYRKEHTGNLDVEKIREIQNTYSQIKTVQEKVTKVLKEDKNNAVPKVPEERKKALLQATTLQEVELLTASLRSSGKKSFADRARELGLDPHGISILEGSTSTKYQMRDSLQPMVDFSKEGLKTIEEVEQGISYIVADIISKDPQVIEFVRKLMKTSKPFLECVRKKATAAAAKVKSENKSKSALGPSEEICEKYKNYFNFNFPAWNTRPHQVLAINRGESQNVLRVKVIISEDAHLRFVTFCQQKWLRFSNPQHYNYHLIMTSMEDSWERLVKPFMQRHTRSQLTEMAEIASIDVFTANLKKLLLSPPLRGKTVIAIDPGFINGCKIGVTNLKGEVLLTTTIYPFGRKGSKERPHWSKDHNAKTLREIVFTHKAELICIGNGTACREMEEYLTQLISNGCFENINVQYTIINESGASQYSISPEAKAEFPDMDINHISAVSLARRLQDPLLEYVKVHPMHLGVGMYQHDIPEKLLHASLDSVMVECVSFVGVDINVASEFVLRKLSGLNKTRSANIVEHRKTKGPFMNREQIKDVKGIGPRTFEQCSGFVKIMPLTLQDQISRTPQTKTKANKACINPLDRTVIHPESYAASASLIKMIEVRPQDIGSEEFIKKVIKFSQSSSLEVVSSNCGVSIHTMQLIFEGLTQPLDFDLRAQFDKPLFRKGVTSVNDLRVGTRLTGTVRNMIHFGAFVDIGVGCDGLIHVSKMNGMKVELGTNVEVTVTSIEKERGRIGLALERVL